MRSTWTERGGVRLIMAFLFLFVAHASALTSVLCAERCPVRNPSPTPSTRPAPERKSCCPNARPASPHSELTEKARCCCELTSAPATVATAVTVLIPSSVLTLVPPSPLWVPVAAPIVADRRSILPATDGSPPAPPPHVSRGRAPPVPL